jgi:hypothetical protein
MTMIVPAGDRCRTGMARRVTSKVALRLTARTASHAAGDGEADPSRAPGHENPLRELR